MIAAIVIFTAVAVLAFVLFALLSTHYYERPMLIAFGTGMVAAGLALGLMLIKVLS